MRQKVRTGLTVAAITFCTFSILLTMATARGMHQEMIQTSVSIFTGHFQIQAQGYLDDPGLEKSFTLPPRVVRDLEADEDVMGVAPRVVSGGLVSTDAKTAGAIIVGVDPEREARSTTMMKKVRDGRFLEPGDQKVAVVGTTLARNMGLKVGDEIQLMVQSFYGSLELAFFRVKGTVETGSPDFDQSLLVLPLSATQEIFELDDMITEASVVLKSERSKKRVMALARQSLDREGSSPLLVVQWEELLPELVEFVLLDNAGGVLYLAILVLVVAFIVLLTITMSVMERVREFGVLMAIGTRPRRVFGVIMIECIMLGLLGTALGLLLGSGPCYYWSVHPIPMAEWADAYKEFGIEPMLRTILIPAMYWGTTLIMMVIVVLASLIPAFRATRIRPVEAMRHV